MSNEEPDIYQCCECIESFERHFVADTNPCGCHVCLCCLIEMDSKHGSEKLRCKCGKIITKHMLCQKQERLERVWGKLSYPWRLVCPSLRIWKRPLLTRNRSTRWVVARQEQWKTRHCERFVLRQSTHRTQQQGGHHPPTKAASEGC